MTAPARLQLSRARGFRLDAASRALNGLPAVKVARPAILGNPFVVRRGEMPDRAVALFASLLGEEHGPALAAAQGLVDRRARILRAIPLLRGKNLACWCAPGAPCHADVLLDLAKRPVCEEVKGQ